MLAVDNPLDAGYLGLDVPFERSRSLAYCGSWIERKGTALLAQALPRLLRRLPDWRLTLVGVGTGFRADAVFPADLLPRIEVVPFAERGSELRRLYQTFALVLVPSVYESFGLVTAEAMACGAAVVATPVGFAAGLRDGEEAKLLAEPTAAALCQAVEELAEDEAQRQRIARGGYRRVQALRWEDAVGAVEAAYARWRDESWSRSERALPGAAPAP